MDAVPEQETKKAKVLRTVFSNAKTGYTVVSMRDIAARSKQNGRFTAVCTVPFALNEGDEIEMQGHWVTSKYGNQFQVTHLKLSDPASIDGIRAYLSSGVLSGIGPVMADRIVGHFGEETLKILDTDPTRLKEVKGIGQKTVDKVISSWSEKRAGAAVLMSLCELGLSVAYATRTFRKFGTEAVTIVTENPYRLTEVKGIGFKKADEIATKVLAFAADHPCRVKSGIEYTLDEASRTGGHCFLIEDELMSKAREFLGVYDRIISDKVIDMVGQGALKKILAPVTNEVRYYLPGVYKAEQFVKQQLERLSGLVTSRTAELDEVLTAERMEFLTGEQQRAVKVGATSGLSIVTGGPGTGKSTTLKAVIEALERLRVRYSLCAPTGKASKRMSEITGREAKTIHRLLEYNPNEGFGRAKGCPLETDVVIVDESSMIDIFLMGNLLDALPMHCALVMIGDADQLPPVGAGNIFKDLIASKKCPVVRFTQVHRQAEGSDIIRTAHEIIRGEKSVTVVSRGNDEERESDASFTPEEDPEEILGLIVHNVTEVFPQSGVTLDEVQVLSPMKNGPLGTANINLRIQQKLHQDKDPKSKVGQFFVGDRVMQLSNDYQKRVFNGDIGVVVDSDPDAVSVTVRFDQDRLVDYETYELDDITLAYAITIHKSQGSEWPIVVIPVTMQHYVMLKRDLIYTGVTRAKRYMFLVGQQKAFYTAVRNAKESKRNTGLWR